MLRVVLMTLCLAFAGSALQAADTPEAEVVAAARAINAQYQRQLKGMVTRLSDPDPTIRRQSFIALAHTYDHAVVPNIVAYLDPDVTAEAVVIDAIHALAILGAAEVTPALERLAQRDEQNIRVAALSALAQIGKLGAGTYQRESDSENGHVRAMAVTELGTLKVKEAAPVLVTALHDSRNHIRRMAAIGLTRLGDRDNGPALVEALTDRDALVRRYAAEGLMILDYKPAIPYLLIALEGGIAGGDINRAVIALTGEDFGYHPHDSAVAHSQAVERGFVWWTENADRF
ncbi:MAG: HEAT repeat domain-containing protein [Planctomycetota bacterium]|jgi:HEAT repeat protein|nr:HEAT repeat domain-containing protein [Planctomycetota bacterium]